MFAGAPPAARGEIRHDWRFRNPRCTCWHTPASSGRDRERFYGERAW